MTKLRNIYTGAFLFVPDDFDATAYLESGFIVDEPVSTKKATQNTSKKPQKAQQSAQKRKEDK